MHGHMALSLAGIRLQELSDNAFNLPACSEGAPTHTTRAYNAQIAESIVNTMLCLLN